MRTQLCNKFGEAGGCTCPDAGRIRAGGCGFMGISGEVETVKFKLLVLFSQALMMMTPSYGSGCLTRRQVVR
jgi:hypothetical protein